MIVSMTMRATEVSNRLDELERELEEVKRMTESEVCEKFSADSKGDYITTLEEEISALEEYRCEYDDDDYDMWDDHGFSSEYDYIRWRYGA